MFRRQIHNETGQCVQCTPNTYNPENQKGVTSCLTPSPGYVANQAQTDQVIWTQDMEKYVHILLMMITVLLCWVYFR